MDSPSRKGTALSNREDTRSSGTASGLHSNGHHQLSNGCNNIQYNQSPSGSGQHVGHCDPLSGDHDNFTGRQSLKAPVSSCNSDGLPSELTATQAGRTIRWGTIIPLIGGSALGCYAATGSLPLFHISYPPFGNNELHLRQAVIMWSTVGLVLVPVRYGLPSQRVATKFTYFIVWFFFVYCQLSQISAILCMGEPKETLPLFGLSCWHKAEVLSYFHYPVPVLQHRIVWYDSEKENRLIRYGS
jgi:hypothetical protein